MALKPISGDKARRFVDTRTGETISRRQAENRRAQSQGLASLTELQKYQRERRSDVNYQQALNQRAKMTGQKTADLAKPGSNFNKEYVKTFFRRDKEGNLVAKTPKKTAGGPLARFLEKQGVRPVGATWDVGQTPDVAKQSGSAEQEDDPEFEAEFEEDEEE